MARESKASAPEMGEAGSHFITLSGHKLPAPPLEAALYLVSTPIGHLKDITIRALETLAACHVIACEDTRVSRTLLQHYGISTRVIAYHEHNADQAGTAILEALDQGPVALISDAGTPLISDPGNRLVPRVLEAGHKIVPIPGASAVLSALVASGLGDEQFYFAGFLPSKSKARDTALQSLANLDATLVLYESPRRLTALLQAAVPLFGTDRPVCVARELTKRFETFYRGSLGALAAQFADSETPKGEVVVLIGRGGPDPASAFDLDAALHAALAEWPLKQAVADVTAASGLPRREVYQRALALKADL